MRIEQKLIYVKGSKANLQLYLMENLQSVDPTEKRPMIVICPGHMRTLKNMI
ncbi:MAG: hypothetical protein ACI4EL_07710 [Candidatus Fimimorpha sp.]